MSNFMMNIISWILLFLVVLTLYLIDKVNHLAKLYEAPQPELPPLPEPEPPSDILFAGLEGKKLWDAMNGKTVEGFDASLIDALRAHYEPILREHITLTFKDGLEDVDGSESRVPSSERRVTTLRGHIQSWLPPQHLGGIYRAALEFAGSYKKNPQSQVFERLKQTVDSVTGMLYQRANIPLEVPFSEFLFDLAKEDEVQEEHQEEAKDDSVLALTDESTQANPIDADALARMQADQLAQGLEQVQQYEDLQRQEIAADTITDVAPQAQEVLEAKPA
ncbi:MAG: hypothetical protein EBR47_08130 [Betaproteobacteria bacterium]|nr:hypothetical protein [Betaproteobacteria bacterium]